MTDSLGTHNLQPVNQSDAHSTRLIHAQPLASTSTSPSTPTPQPANATATATPTSDPTPTPTPIIPLLSTSPTDPTRTRTFLAKYFLPVEHDAPLRAALDLPEAYFAPTASELQQAFAGQVRRREQLVDAPMLTQKLRDQEEARKTREKAGRWPQVSGAWRGGEGVALRRGRGGSVGARGWIDVN